MSKNNFDSGELNYLNTLAAGLVHEIKNPLNAISINLQLLNEDLQDRNSERDVQKCQAGSSCYRRKSVDWIIFLVIF